MLRRVAHAEKPAIIAMQSNPVTSLFTFFIHISLACEKNICLYGHIFRILTHMDLDVKPLSVDPDIFFFFSIYNMSCHER